jgi:histone-lysine N-methyltransferase SETMAR
MEWRHSGSRRPKKYRVQKLAEKFSTRFFGIKTASSSLSSKGQTINAEYYSSLLELLKDILEGKDRGKFTKGVLFLHDSTPAHRALTTRNKLDYLGFQILDHTPHSPDLAPSDYHLFPGLIKQLTGRQFSSETEVIATAETWLDGQPSDFFLSGLHKL